MCIPAVVLLLSVGAAGQVVEFHEVPPAGVRELANWAGMFEDEAGRIYVSSGDHAGQAGNSWLHRFDPSTAKITTLIDVRRDAGDLFDAQGLGHGKFHAAPLRGSDGRLYISTYYYDKPGDDVETYQGSLLFSFDPKLPEAVRSHGVIFPGQGTVTAVLLPGRSLYAAMVKPSGRMMVYDLVGEKIAFRSPHPADGAESPTRLCAADRHDRVYYQTTDGAVYRYDPASGDVTPLPLAVPSARDLPTHNRPNHKPDRADFIRAMHPVGETEMLGVTHYGLFFLFDTKTLRTTALSHALDREPLPGGYYVPDFAVNAAGDTAYYVGGTENKIGDYAHDNPVIAFNFRTGEKRVLARLNQVMRERKLGRFRYNFGCLLTRDERSLYLCPNSSAGTHVYLVRIGLENMP